MVFNDIQFAVSSKAVGIIFGNDVLSKFLVLKYHELSTVMAFVIHLFLFDFFFTITVIKIYCYVSVKIIAIIITIITILHPLLLPSRDDRRVF